jgi:peptidoglycan/xylan/chitin deacetylase (PgdA/CDA1 family)
MNPAHPVTSTLTPVTYPSRQTTDGPRVPGSRGAYRAGVFARIVTSALGSRAVSGVAQRATQRSLRILAYHDVTEPAAFADQLAYLSRYFEIVSGSQVVAWLRGEDHGERPLVWLTFDDADLSVVEAGLPLLEAHRAPATLYQVASVVDTSEPFWWQVAERARDRGASIPTVSQLKQVEDERRRMLVEVAWRHLAERDPAALHQPQMTTEHLRRWIGSGREVGSHTWDHPCLDRCAPEESSEQVRRAAAWVDSLGVAHPRAFAYPNGNFDPTTDAVLRELGYATALLAGHRLTPRSSDPLHLQRLRVDASAPLGRFRAILSGAHSAVFHLGKRV